MAALPGAPLRGSRASPRHRTSCPLTTGLCQSGAVQSWRCQKKQAATVSLISQKRAEVGQILDCAQGGLSYRPVSYWAIIVTVRIAAIIDRILVTAPPPIAMSVSSCDGGAPCLMDLNVSFT